MLFCHSCSWFRPRPLKTDDKNFVSDCIIEEKKNLFLTTSMHPPWSGSNYGNTPTGRGWVQIYFWDASCYGTPPRTISPLLPATDVCPHILVHLGWHIFFHATIHIRHRLVGRLGLGLCGVPLEGIPVVSHEKYQDACSVVEHRTLPPHCDWIWGYRGLLLMNTLFNARGWKSLGQRRGDKLN